jgi:predicted CoA-binding protein
MIDVSEREQLLRIYAQARTIAVVGASADESKAAHQIPRYLQSQGYRIVPVNPRGGVLFGERVFRSLAEVDVPVDVVDVFRPADEAPEIAGRRSRSARRCSGSNLGSSRRKPGRSRKQPVGRWS